jgi:hypothetical protein
MLIGLASSLLELDGGRACSANRRDAFWMTARNIVANGRNHEEKLMHPEGRNDSLDETADSYGPTIAAADHSDHTRKRNPDRELRLDGEKDTLYDDGLDIDTDGDTLAGTDGKGPKGIKG